MSNQQVPKKTPNSKKETAKTIAKKISIGAGILGILAGWAIATLGRGGNCDS